MKLEKDGFIVEIDQASGFCFGVVHAIDEAEKELEKNGKLYCLGDIVHNSSEVERLQDQGLITIDHAEFAELKDVTVLLRAHGEPPETYDIAKQNNIKLIDATCGVVLRLQKKIKKGYNEALDNKGQVVIYGKKGHAEVNGLVGQTQGNALVVEKIEDVEEIDLGRPIALFSQTTKSLEGLVQLGELLKKKMDNPENLQLNDTVCRQVINRLPHLKEFVRKYEAIVFVSGKKSSNGKMLFEKCKELQPNTYLVSDDTELQNEWFINTKSVGVCGATSTPEWLMQKVAENIMDRKQKINQIKK